MFLALSQHAVAQSDNNVYKFLTTTSSLYKIDSLYPLQGIAQLGLPGLKDDKDGSSILAADTGSGIITHIWATTDMQEDGTQIKLWIDDSLILSSNFKGFFLSNNSFLRAPFDTTISGGFVSDVQIPYKHNFRITYSGSTLFFYNILWRKVLNVLESFSLQSNSSIKKFQELGESRYYNHPIIESPFETLIIDTTISPQSSTTIFYLDFSGIINRLTFQSPEDITMSSLIIRVFWDDSSLPAVEVPLRDFFCQEGISTNYVSYFLQRDSLGKYISYFPMPFAKSARVEIINRSNEPKKIEASIDYHHKSINRHSDGYFYAKFNESNPTKYGWSHRILHQMGKGRYIGTILEIPSIAQYSSLEGNPKFIIDSSQKFSFEITGTEDYFNGGWYFKDGVFDLPFAGCINYPNNLYRFHVLDAIDFRTSIDVNIQHGNNNDVHEDYRTIAFYYLEHERFTCNRDSIRARETWRISGAGYLPFEEIIARLGSYPLFTINADSNGIFQKEIEVNPNWQPSTYKLNVNEEVSAINIVVLKMPVLSICADLPSLYVSEGDTIRIIGTCFTPGEEISLFVNGAKLETPPFLISKDYRFSTIAKIPHIKSGKYPIVANASISGISQSEDSVLFLDYLNYEFEDLLSNAERRSVAAYDRVSYYWFAKWGKQAFVTFYPDGVGDSITFHFEVPYTDSFQVILSATKGQDYGNYMYSIDGKMMGEFSGYHYDQYFDPLPFDTSGIFNLHFSQGVHSISFISNGKNSLAKKTIGGFDYMRLKPISSQNSVSIHSLEQSIDLNIFPNPSNNAVHLQLDNLKYVSKVEFYDLLGRSYYPPYTLEGNIATINVKNLPIGTYIVRVGFRNKEYDGTFTLPLIVQH